MISPEHRPGRPEAGQHIRSSDCSSHFSLSLSFLVWNMLNESAYNVLFLLHIIIVIWSTGQIDRNAAIDIVWIFIFNRYMSLSLSAPIPARCQLDSTQLLFVSFILLGGHHYWGVKGRPSEAWKGLLNPLCVVPLVKEKTCDLQAGQEFIVPIRRDRMLALLLA